jgi:hypothetical protein
VASRRLDACRITRAPGRLLIAVIAVEMACTSFATETTPDGGADAATAGETDAAGGSDAPGGSCVADLRNLFGAPADPDFERGCDAWRANGADAGVPLATAAGRCGVSACRFCPGNRAFLSSGLAQATSGVAGQQYRGAFWVRAAGGTDASVGRAWTEIAVNGGGHPEGTQIAVTSEWSEVSGTFDPTEPVDFQLFLRFEPASPSGCVDVDSAALVRTRDVQ